MNPVLAALATFIQPALNYAEQKLASIGAAFLGSFGLILNQFTNDQRQIGANVLAYWQAHFHAAVAAGADQFTAAEQATTATMNEFAKEEGSEVGKVASMVTTALELAIKNGLKS